MSRDSFEWDPEKDFSNRAKHGVSFSQAQFAFADPNRVIAEDLSHSQHENTITVLVVSGRHSDRPVYLGAGSDPDIRRRLLAQGITDL